MLIRLSVERVSRNLIEGTITAFAGEATKNHTNLSYDSHSLAEVQNGYHLYASPIC
jgi:hypothetical protein